MFDRIGFTSVTFRKLSVQQIMNIAKDNKIDYIEWGADVHIKPDNDILATHAILKEDTSIAASSYGSYYVVGEDNLNKFKTICYIARQIGANIVRVWLGNKSSADTNATTIDKMALEVNKMADIAESMKVTIAFEYHKNTLNDNPKSTLAFIKKVGRQNVRTYWQPMGDDKQDILDLTEICYYVVGVHVFEWNKNGVRKPLKKGVNKWTEVFKLLSERHINPIIIMEFVKNDSPKQFAKDICVLRGILKQFVND